MIQRGITKDYKSPPSITHIEADIVRPDYLLEEAGYKVWWKRIEIGGWMSPKAHVWKAYPYKRRPIPGDNPWYRKESISTDFYRHLGFVLIDVPRIKSLPESYPVEELFEPELVPTLLRYAKFLFSKATKRPDLVAAAMSGMNEDDKDLLVHILAVIDKEDKAREAKRKS